MAPQRGLETAPALARSDPEEIAVRREGRERRKRARKQWLSKIGPGARRGEGLLIARSEQAGIERRIGRNQRGQGLGKRQPDHGARLRGLGRRDAAGLEGRADGREDRVLAVDERAVAVEHREAEGDQWRHTAISRRGRDKRRADRNDATAGRGAG